VYSKHEIVKRMLKSFSGVLPAKKALYHRKAPFSLAPLKKFIWHTLIIDINCVFHTSCIVII